MICFCVLYDGKEIRYTYDDSRRLTSVQTPFGTTSYEYDLLDRLVRVVAHDGTDLDVISCRPGVYLIPNNENLYVGDRIVGFGEVGGIY